MVKIAKKIVKLKIPIIIIAILLIVPSIIGMQKTRVNYDILTYLPDDIDTMKGQDILLDDFGKGAFSLIVVEGMEDKDVEALEDQIKDVAHVESAIWYTDIMDLSIPKEILPEKYYDAFNNGDATLMAVFFDAGTSDDDTIQAIRNIRSITGEKCFVTGMSAMVADLSDLCTEEEPTYVAIAVILSLVAMMVFMDNWIIPVLFLANIGIGILWNLGSNIIFGEISFITKAIAAVLQLAVTMDYSIFLWNSYNENKKRFPGDNNRAMAHALSNTFTSVMGSSVTTIAGFIALCFMEFTLGKDLGLVMAKGVVLGVISCLTVLPSMILLLDKPLVKTQHKPLLPDMKKISTFIVKKSWIFLILFVIILVPAFYGYNNTSVYYDMSSSLPEDLDFVIANKELQDKFDMASTHMILCDSNMESVTCKQMMDEIEDVDGVNAVIGYDSIVGTEIPDEVIPDSVKDMLESGDYQLILVTSKYYSASDEVNNQISEINDILQKYDDDAMLIGEAPCMKDMITITDHDFEVVTIVSTVLIFIIIFFVEKSITLPLILIAVIEFAIFINLGIPYYTGTTLSFIAPIVVSTIQLGATVDYAILMTTRYKKERSRGTPKEEAVITALNSSMPSIIVSALGLFAATIGVSIYSNIDIISSICTLLGRGAIISMFCVCLVLPAFLRLFDGMIIHTTLGMNPDHKKKTKKEIRDKKKEITEKNGSNLVEVKTEDK